VRFVYSMASQSTSRKGRPKAAELFINKSGPSQKSDVGLYMSRDGRRVEQAFTSPKKKCRIAPSALDDTFASWLPGIEMDQGDDAVAHVVCDPEVLGKRKQYLSSVRYCPISTDYLIRLPNVHFQDQPMRVWSKDHKDEFLRELLQHEGLGENWRNPTCGTCHQSLIPSPNPTLDPPTQNPCIIHCQDCFGGLQECVDCCLRCHARLPLHVLDVNIPTLPLTL
jgi:hypothetical protein